jgi:hypothetical protein
MAFFSLSKGCILPSTDVSTGASVQPTGFGDQTTSNTNYNSNNPSSLGMSNNATLNLHQNSSSMANQPAAAAAAGMLSSRALTPKHDQSTTHHQQQNAFVHVVSISSRDVKRRPEMNETVFRVTKGVKTFDFSFEKNLLITGG